MADLERRTIIPIAIDMKLEQIPETAICVGCNNWVRRAVLTFERSFTVSGKLAIARCDAVPGYRCEDDGAEFYDLGASVKVLSETLEVIRSVGDTRAAEQVTASLNVGLQLLAERNFFSRHKFS